MIPHLIKPAGMVMKSVIAATVVLAGATLASAPASTQGAGNSFRPCTAQVVHSEELPFAPIDNWLVKVTFSRSRRRTEALTSRHCRTGCRGKVRRRDAARRFDCGAIPPIRTICTWFPAPPQDPRSDRNRPASLTRAHNERDQRPHSPVYE